MQTTPPGALKSSTRVTARCSRSLADGLALAEVDVEMVGESNFRPLRPSSQADPIQPRRRMPWISLGLKISLAQEWDERVKLSGLREEVRAMTAHRCHDSAARHRALNVVEATLIPASGTGEE